MPEGPEVRVIGNTVAKAIGHTITAANHTQSKKYKWKRDGIPGWDKLKLWIPSEQTYLTSWTVEDVIVKGKLIRIDIFSGETKLSILNTLGLEGTWFWNLTTKDSRNKYKRVWFDFHHGERLAYYDSRNFGTIKIVERKEADAKLQKIGWDLLQAPMPEETWKALQSDKKIKEKPIGEILMRQSEFSGIGNIYKAETLYDLKIHPSILVEDLDPDLWEQVNHSAHRIMQESYQANGSSVKSYNGGSFQRSLKVYKQKTCPQNHPIKSMQQAKRTTWYCETCQKLPCITPSTTSNTLVSHPQ